MYFGNQLSIWPEHNVWYLYPKSLAWDLSTQGTEAFSWELVECSSLCVCVCVSVFPNASHTHTHTAAFKKHVAGRSFSVDPKQQDGEPPTARWPGVPLGHSPAHRRAWRRVGMLARARERRAGRLPARRLAERTSYSARVTEDTGEQPPSDLDMLSAAETLQTK